MPILQFIITFATYICSLHHIAMDGVSLYSMYWTYPTSGNIRFNSISKLCSLFLFCSGEDPTQALTCWATAVTTSPALLQIFKQFKFPLKPIRHLLDNLSFQKLLSNDMSLDFENIKCIRLGITPCFFTRALRESYVRLLFTLLNTI